MYRVDKRERQHRAKRKSPATTRTSRTDEHQACKLTCGQGEHGRSVQQREQNRADNPGGSHVSLARLLFVSVLFPRVALFLLLLLPRWCRLFDPGAKLRTARRRRGVGRKQHGFNLNAVSLVSFFSPFLLTRQVSRRAGEKCESLI